MRRPTISDASQKRGAILSVATGGMMQQHVTPMAFIGALVGAIMIDLLKRTRILV